ncbi:MAG: oligosaccharide flippase family protein [Hungatella sp.]|nr:oligosaccharide flippase family protein [Hungatella sp.]
MRIDNVIKNSSLALFAQIITNFFKFVTQVIFVRTLSIEYLGVNGLFSNILTMLSLAELGVGTAILYNMYKPLAQNDQSRIKGLMNFYKETYTKIGIFVLAAGIFLTPFLGFLIKDTPDIPELKLVYILYVVNNAASYFFVYKQSILIADQKNYVVTKVTIIKNITMSVFQILLLLLTRKFLPYLLISIVCTIVFNIVGSILSERYYPYLKNNDEYLMTEEKRDIYKDVYALMSHKVGGVIVFGTDNLLLSAFVGVTAVGLYSNYMMILNSVKGFLNQIYESLVSSIGNLVNKESDEKIFFVYKNMFFISFWISSLVSISFYCLSGRVIELLFGKNYLLSNQIIFLMSLNFYIADLNGMRAITSKFKGAQGLFWNDRYKPYFESAINMCTSVILLKFMGFSGILLGTLLSTLTTGFWIEPLVLFKYGFNMPVRDYYKIFFKDTVIFALSWLITAMIMKLLPAGISGILIGCVICILVPSTLVILMYRTTTEFAYCIVLIKTIIRKVLHR